MKAITVLQPYASLIAVGAKQYETRSWSASYRGPIAIHAGKKPSNGLFPLPVIFALVRTFGKSALEVLDTAPLGAVVAVAERKGCHRTIRTHTCDPDTGEPSAIIHAELKDAAFDWRIDGDELLFGDFSPGRFAWELTDVKMLKEPVPARGRQGLWTLPPEVEAETMRRI
jgi:hypothetical protein